MRSFLSGRLPLSEAAPKSAPGPAAAPDSDEETSGPDPCCPKCGAALPGVLSYRPMDASGADGRRRFIVAYCGACGCVLGVG